MDTIDGISFSEAITIAANHNDDSDLTASVSGQLYGAWKGVDDIPHDWIVRLDVFGDIVSLVAKAETKGAQVFFCSENGPKYSSSERKK